MPTVTMSCPRELQERYLGLLEGSESYRCGQTLAQMPEVKLYGLLTELTVERLERKYNDFLTFTAKRATTGTKRSTSCCSARWAPDRTASLT